MRKEAPVQREIPGMMWLFRLIWRRNSSAAEWRGSWKPSGGVDRVAELPLPKEPASASPAVPVYVRRLSWHNRCRSTCPHFSVSPMAPMGCSAAAVSDTLLHALRWLPTPAPRVDNGHLRLCEFC